MKTLKALAYLILAGVVMVACRPDEPQPPINTTYPAPTAYNLPPTPGFPNPIIKSDNPLTVEGIELGRALFYDPVLSGDNTQSCASCHNPQFAFTDNGNVFSTGISGAIGTRNSMPLFNLMWNTRYFWDGRSATLREQVLLPIQDPIEMHESLPNAIQELNAISAYKTRFGKAFGNEDITTDRMAKALEQFIFAMVSGQSKFDLSMRGLTTLSPAEERGLDIFRGEFSPRDQVDRQVATASIAMAQCFLQIISFSITGLTLFSRISVLKQLPEMPSTEVSLKSPACVILL